MIAFHLEKMAIYLKNVPLHIITTVTVDFSTDFVPEYSECEQSDDQRQALVGLYNYTGRGCPV